MCKLDGTAAVAITTFIFLSLGVGVLVFTPPPRPTAPGGEDNPVEIRAGKALADSAITFEKNVGQAAPSAQYLSRVNGSTVFLTPDSMIVRMPGRRTPQTLSALDKARLKPQPDIPPATRRYRR